MNGKKFLWICYLSMMAILLVWLIMMVYMGQYATIPRMIGSFVVGWYLNKIIETVKKARKEYTLKDSKPVRVK